MPQILLILKLGIFKRSSSGSLTLKNANRLWDSPQPIGVFKVYSLTYFESIVVTFNSLFLHHQNLLYIFQKQRIRNHLM